MIIINYKAYDQAIGENAETLTSKIEKAAESTDKEVIVNPQTADLRQVEPGKVELYAQHMDPVETGSHTGSNQVKALKDAGVTGTLINHSERRLEDEKIQEIVEKCKKEDLTSVVCAQTPEECGKYSKFDPDCIAFEPPELIGGDISVSKAEPEVIEEAVKESGEVTTLTGAGIKTRKDVEKSIEHGCEGILVASGVIKAKDVQEEVEELCRGL